MHREVPLPQLFGAVCLLAPHSRATPAPACRLPPPPLQDHIRQQQESFFANFHKNRVADLVSQAAAGGEAAGGGGALAAPAADSMDTAQ